MAKLTLSDLASLANETSAVATINANNALIEAALENTLSRDGTSPNQMESELDMNSNLITNVATPTASTHVATKAYVDAQLGSAAAAEAWAITAEDTLVPSSAGGNEVDQYSALHWAAKAEEYRDAAEGFADTYVGPAASDPSTRLDGSALVEGDLYYNTSGNALYVYNGSSWDQAAASTAGFPTLAGSNVWTAFNSFRASTGIEVGIADDTPGNIEVRGGGATEVGGAIRVYNSADNDSSSEFTKLYHTSGDATFRIERDAATLADISIEVGGSIRLAQDNGNVYIGNDDTQAAILHLYGGATFGATTRYYQGASEDALTGGEYFSIAADGGQLLIRDASNTGAITVLEDCSLRFPQHVSGVLTTDGSGNLTADTSTYVKTSGNSFTSGTGTTVYGTGSNITVLVVESGTIKTATIATTALPVPDNSG